MLMDQSGNDNWNGLNSTWVNTTNGPKATTKCNWNCSIQWKQFT
jgi:hypothetical protein